MNTQQRQQVIDIYRKRAGNYDFTANLYYLFGYPEWAHRRRAIEKLQLKPGDTVIEIACGTGLNFPLYQKAIGPEGKIIGVDLTDAMLEQARHKVEDNGWDNVELVHSDALTYQFPDGIDAIISTYALSLIPEAEQVLENAVKALSSGGRLALLEFKIPENWPSWLVSFIMWLFKPFAVNDEWLERRAWESITQTVQNLLADVTISEMYLGLTYIITGKRVNLGSWGDPAR